MTVDASPAVPHGAARITLIAAVARNRAIGRDNGLLWRIPEDLKRFKAITLGSPIVMGRKTFDSIGRALPGRVNIVISRQQHAGPEGVVFVDSFDTAIAACGAAPEIFVIGGEQVYALAMPVADRMVLTEVDATASGDVFFPLFYHAQWREVSREHRDAAGDLPAFDFVEYRRVRLA